MDKTLAERLRDCAQGVRLGADGMGWSPDPALLEEAADKIVSLHAELQHARDGLTKGRTRMREDIARLQAEVEQLRAENAALKREAHIANAARVLKWADERPRRAPNLAFPAGPERQAAYWIEWAEQREISIAQAGIDAVRGSAALSAP